jgi:hypothetical protein
LFQFVLLLGWVVLIFQRYFSLLAIGLQIFLSLSAAAVSSVELSPVPCLWCRHRHQHSHAFAVQKVVLECDVVFSALAFIRASSFALRSWSVMLEGSGTKEIHSLREDGGLLDLSLLECSSWTSLWWHRELFTAETRWAPMLGGVSENPDKIPKHKRRINTNVRVKVANDVRGDNGSPKNFLCLKSCESFYTCPYAPFYKETKGLLHSDNTLDLKEYSQCEHIHKCLLHLIYLQVCH